MEVGGCEVGRQEVGRRIILFATHPGESQAAYYCGNTYRSPFGTATAVPGMRGNVALRGSHWLYKICTEWIQYMHVGLPLPAKVKIAS